MLIPPIPAHQCCVQFSLFSYLKLFSLPARNLVPSPHLNDLLTMLELHHSIAKAWVVSTAPPKCFMTELFMKGK